MSTWPAVVLAGTAIVAGTISSVVPRSTPSATDPPVRPASTVITVDVAAGRGKAPTMLLGVNHHYNANGYHLWDPDIDAPADRAATGAIRAGISSMRFPGGTVANLYDWKRALGSSRGCQVVGPHGPRQPASRLTHELRFGPDEYMRFTEQVGAKPILMVPFVTETPRDAADWVEYMNSPASAPGNPGGGRDWADVRARHGHPAPYGVHWWEIGNEQHHAHSRYWMSPDDGTAARQYANGGARLVERENLGKKCLHTEAGTPSDGTPGQVFEVLYPPVEASTVEIVVDGRPWHRVEDLAGSGPRQRVFTVNAERGRVRFGDGTHGAIPPAKRVVHASYRTVHEGFFSFARRMHEVDPSIEVCSSWGTARFATVAGDRDFDCLTAHAITLLRRPGDKEATSPRPVDGHDLAMVKTGAVIQQVRQVLDSLPRSRPLLLTEFLGMHGSERAFTGWPSSQSQAVFMASLWATWLRMGIRWGTGDDFLWGSGRGMLGPAPDFLFTPDAVTRRALTPMFGAGGEVVASATTGNPVRQVPSLHTSYQGLTTVALRNDGVLWILVVNRLPRHDVTARVVVTGARPTGLATLRVVRAASFRSLNSLAHPHRVFLEVRHRSVDGQGFNQLFRAASTTVIRIPLR